MAENAMIDMTQMTDVDFNSWLSRKAPEDSEVHNMLIVFRQTVKNAPATAQKPMNSPVEAVKTVKKDKNDCRFDCLNEKLQPVCNVGKAPQPIPITCAVAQDKNKKNCH